jgi:hypothetical protein
MTVINIADYAKDKPGGEGDRFDHPMSITFFGSKFAGLLDPLDQLTFRVCVTDGEVWKILEEVKRQGGIGTMKNGRYVYMPWPCAAVVIHEVDDELFGLPEDQR